MNLILNDEFQIVDPLFASRMVVLSLLAIAAFTGLSIYFYFEVVLPQKQITLGITNQKNIIGSFVRKQTIKASVQ